MDLNALWRLGVRRHRHGVDQQVLVDIMTPLSLVIWFALISRELNLDHAWLDFTCT